jgi:hypothetical protein
MVGKGAHKQVGDYDYLLNLASALRSSRKYDDQASHIRISCEAVDAIADRLDAVARRRKIITGTVIPILVSCLVATWSSLVGSAIAFLLLRSP